MRRKYKQSVHKKSIIEAVEAGCNSISEIVDYLGIDSRYSRSLHNKLVRLAEEGHICHFGGHVFAPARGTNAEEGYVLPPYVAVELPTRKKPQRFSETTVVRLSPVFLGIVVCMVLGVVLKSSYVMIEKYQGFEHNTSKAIRAQLVGDADVKPSAYQVNDEDNRINWSSELKAQPTLVSMKESDPELPTVVGNVDRSGSIRDMVEQIYTSRGADHQVVFVGGMPTELGVHIWIEGVDDKTALRRIASEIVESGQPHLMPDEIVIQFKQKGWGPTHCSFAVYRASQVLDNSHNTRPHEDVDVIADGSYTMRLEHYRDPADGPTPEAEAPWMLHGYPLPQRMTLYEYDLIHALPNTEQQLKSAIEAEGDQRQWPSIKNARILYDFITRCQDDGDYLIDEDYAPDWRHGNKTAGLSPTDVDESSIR